MAEPTVQDVVTALREEASSIDMGISAGGTLSEQIRDVAALVVSSALERVADRVEGKI